MLRNDSSSKVELPKQEPALRASCLLQDSRQAGVFLLAFVAALSVACYLFVLGLLPTCRVYVVFDLGFLS